MRNCLARLHCKFFALLVAGVGNAVLVQPLVVHPECRSDVVGAADAVGSTAFICKFVEESNPGDTILIGTEVNLTTRLAYEFPDRKVIPLSRSLCPNMFRISMEKLRDTLRDLPNTNEIILPEEIIGDARLAMERMLALA